MHPYSRPSALSGVTHGEIDGALLLDSDPVQSRRAAVAQKGALPTGKDRRHPSPFLAEFRSSHLVDALLDAVQAPGAEAVLDRVVGKAKLQQLPPREQPMLPPRELPGGGTTRG